MNSQGRAKAIFLGALEIASEEQRRRFMEAQCGEDEGLRAEVEALLRHHQQVGSFLQTPAMEPGRTQSVDAPNSPRSDDAAPERTEVEPVSAGDDVALAALRPSDDPKHLGRVGSYEITEVVGRGGMGIVFKGNDPKLQRVVAIKVLAPELARNATARKRFLREARAAAAITHQQVVTIHAVDEDKLPYLVMEFVAGQSLQEKIEREGTLQLREVLRIGTQVASGLAAAHAQGLIHRDIKPANILLENGVERVRITDFGLARAVDDVSITTTGEVPGTPQYMSPEQAQGHAVDARSDLFNLGCVLYAMCTGRSPFRAETTIAALRRVCDDAARPIREINPDVPEWLARIVEKLLAKNPQDRFQSAGEVADLLGRHLAHVQDSSSALHPCTLRGLRSRRGKLLRVCVAAAVLLGLLGLLGLTEATGVTRIAGGLRDIVRGKAVDEVRVAEGSVAAAGKKIVHMKRYLAHTSPVSAVAISPAGDVIASGSTRSIRLTDRHTGELIRFFEGYTDFISDLKFTADGRGLVSAGRDGTVRLWNVASGDEIRQFTSHDGWAACVDISPQRQTVVSGGQDRKIHVSELETGKLLHTIDARAEIVWTVQFSNQGRSLVTGTNDGALRLWDADTGEQITRFAGHEGNAYSARFSPDGRFLVSGGSDNMARLWDVSSGKAVHTWPHARDVTSVAFTAHGQFVVTGGRDKALHLWSVESGQEVARANAQTFCTLTIALTPEGQHVVSAGGTNFDRELQQWRGDGDYELHIWRLPESVRPLAGGQTDQMIEVRRFEGHTGTVKQVAISRDGRLALSGSGFYQGDGSVRLWEMATGRELRSLGTSGGQIMAVCFSHDGQRAAAGGYGGVVDLWNVESGQPLTSLRINTEVLVDLAFSPDDRHLLWVTTQNRADNDKEEIPDLGTVELWDLETDERVWKVDSEGWMVRGDFLAEGNRIAVAGYRTGAGVHILARDTGRELQRLENITEPLRIEGLGVSRDGRFIVASSESGSLCVWDVELGGRPVRSKRGMGKLRTVAFSPDGRRLLCGSGYQTTGRLHLLEFPSLRTIASVNHPPGMVWDVAYAPDGRHALSAGGWINEEFQGDYDLRLWRLPESGEPQEQDSPSL